MSAVLLCQNKSATSNQSTVLFSQNKSAPVISHKPKEQAVWLEAGWLVGFGSVHCSRAAITDPGPPPRAHTVACRLWRSYDGRRVPVGCSNGGNAAVKHRGTLRVASSEPSKCAWRGWVCFGRKKPSAMFHLFLLLTPFQIVDHFEFFNLNVSSMQLIIIRAIAFVPSFSISIAILPRLFLTLHFYPYCSNMKASFTPICNSVTCIWVKNGK
jgi:hypothetical protein